MTNVEARMTKEIRMTKTKFKKRTMSIAAMPVPIDNGRSYLTSLLKTVK